MIYVVIKSPHYKIWLKNANYMDEFNCLQCFQNQEIINYTLNTYLNTAFYRLILIIQKNDEINILSVPFIILNFLPFSRAKKGQWHLDHFTNIFWVKRTFTWGLSSTQWVGKQKKPEHLFFFGFPTQKMLKYVPLRSSVNRHLYFEV